MNTAANTAPAHGYHATVEYDEAGSAENPWVYTITFDGFCSPLGDLRGRRATESDAQHAVDRIVTSLGFAPYVEVKP